MLLRAYVFQHVVIVPDSLNIAKWQNKIIERQRKFLQVLKFSFLILQFTWCDSMNKNGHQRVELFYKVRRNRMCGLVVESVPLEMALKYQKSVT